MSNFYRDIEAFNKMYGMPVAGAPVLINAQRLRDFKAILAKELDEIDPIIEKLQAYEDGCVYDPEAELDMQTDLTDLLGDLQVYAASEMAKWGLPLNDTLSVIMLSNFSKMGADGKPIYDGQGKLQKGPNYWKPEPRLRMLLKAKQLEAEAQAQYAAAEALHDEATKVRKAATASTKAES